MKLRDVQRLELPPSADMHVHLRQGAMMELVVPQIRRGGVDTVFVMPNLQPPITTVAQALEYKALLQAIEPRVTYLMSLFLHPSVTPSVIAEAAAAGIVGVKLYPQDMYANTHAFPPSPESTGVTTNSENGVSSFDDFAATFAAMEAHGLVLNLHGEAHGDVPAAAGSLEEAFLPTLADLHARFPRLRIVLEHCSTAGALDAVRACGPEVAATITAHHLYLTGDDSKVDPLAFCKPIPKRASDRDALLRAVVSGDPKFFFGSDSAPHPLASKRAAPPAPPPAGVFTQPVATQLVVLAVEEAAARGVVDDADADAVRARLEGFLSRHGRAFYRLPPPPPPQEAIRLERRSETVPASVGTAGALEVGVSRAGAPVFSLSWVPR
ncbi:dihydroorotase, homodimeric type [Durotheca rogersii]|uniref:dihydroorotase, homodimeric type n=1 Tax=Durotheca rogersii TaxID=419775 RepID=UPI00221F7DBD|nr:dihydroorotase, homodimeric type [Durotheca rogersii]KAI5867653.1 dihydroorotase, homodimeric type [Durotheca rogersii]